MRFSKILSRPRNFDSHDIAVFIDLTEFNRYVRMFDISWLSYTWRLGQSVLFMHLKKKESSTCLTNSFRRPFARTRFNTYAPLLSMPNFYRIFTFFSLSGLTVTCSPNWLVEWIKSYSILFINSTGCYQCTSVFSWKCW